ncbi:nucleoside 2-deoxyribosyltransferase [Vibrio vulnificus]|uniref:nucleoside 2-deoxyribosyltransferase n=1 Tax=Vibrio vulnificus TaxID=672 RepID=UPI001CDD1614|nr:nucleoside 2-deoxyribosyltransferase [Vibrio vulnificus]EIV8497302.1 hypothetical protein [Vibrio vulnificus]ELE6573001.1 hypothetical protein [Vibrio parahaemolyticus]ELV8674980.1 hypothetical protein [Vibrio vulnificus]MCA3945108.1 hypothetical protein [Vibrio vulnificus]
MIVGSMTPFETLISMALLLLVMTAVMALMFYMLQKKRESRYDDEKKKIELDLLRHNVESQIYGLNERLMKTPERFEDAYHLQLDGNRKSDFKKPIKLNEFLKSASIKEEDLSEKDFVFVLTPFHSKFDGVYDEIKNVCDKADIRCIRGDEQNFKGDIFSHVLKNIVQAKVVIANLSGRNPNVLYELGIAHALDKTTILVSNMLDELPADIKSKRIVVYKDVGDLEERLPVELLKAFK